MKPKLERWIMLLACGSPGSALAYHRSAAESESEMVRRTMSRTTASSAETEGVK